MRKCLHVGVVLDAYHDVIERGEVVEKRQLVKEESEAEEQSESLYGTEEEMRARAGEGYFVRDPEQNLVYCPMRDSSTEIHKEEWKEIDFGKDTLEKPNRNWSD